MLSPSQAFRHKGNCAHRVYTHHTGYFAGTLSSIAQHQQAAHAFANQDNARVAVGSLLQQPGILSFPRLKTAEIVRKIGRNF